MGKNKSIANRLVLSRRRGLNWYCLILYDSEGKPSPSFILELTELEHKHLLSVTEEGVSYRSLGKL